jgi:hypothetical protein
LEKAQKGAENDNRRGDDDVVGSKDGVRVAYIDTIIFSGETTVTTAVDTMTLTLAR